MTLGRNINKILERRDLWKIDDRIGVDLSLRGFQRRTDHPEEGKDRDEKMEDQNRELDHLTAPESGISSFPRGNDHA